jgi:hypothetical protein
MNEFCFFLLDDPAKPFSLLCSNKNTIQATMFRRAFQPVQQALLFGRGCRTFATAKDATSSASGSEQLKVTFATPNQACIDCTG